MNIGRFVQIIIQRILIKCLSRPTKKHCDIAVWNVVHYHDFLCFSITFVAFMQSNVLFLFCIFVASGNQTTIPDSAAFNCDTPFLSLSLSLPGGRQYGCSSQQILCHSASPETQAGNHRRFVLHGSRTANPVLQVDPVQAHQDHFLQRWSSWGTVAAGNTA